MTEGVDIRLSSDEALVLFELLSRWSQDDSAAKPDAACFQSPAEPSALISVLARLQTELSAPFASDYKAQLEAARQRVVLQCGDDFAL